MANDCEKITFYAPSDRRGGVKPIPSCEPGQLIVPEDLPVPPNPETPEPTFRVPRPLEVRSKSYKFICDNKKDRKDYEYGTDTSVKIPAKYLSPVSADEPGYIENYYHGSGSAVIVPEGYVTTTIPFSSVPDIASDVLNYIAVNNRETDIEALLQLSSTDRAPKLVRSYGFTTAQAEALVNLFDAAQIKANNSAYTYGESTLVCVWENTAQETSCEDPAMAHYYDHPDAVHHAVITAGTYKSLISQADADRMAADAAAAMLNCFYISNAVQVSCTDLGYEEPVPNTDNRIGTVVVPQGTFTSTIGIEDATEQARTYAKSLLICYYTNTKIELSCEDDNARSLGVIPTADNRVEITLTANNSRIPGKGQSIIIEPGVIRSNISTEAAMQEATLMAESLLECCFVNSAKTVTCPAYEYTYTDENGVKQTEPIPASEEKSPQYSMDITAGVFSSCVSQEEADREAETFIQSALSCYYCNTVVLPTCIPDDILQKVKADIVSGDYSVLPLNPDNYDISQWSEDATIGAPPEYVCGLDYEQAQQIAEATARTVIHDLRSTESSKCRYTNDLLYAGCYFDDPFGNDRNAGTKTAYYKAYAPGLGKIPYFVYKANVDRRLNKNMSTPTLGTYVAIPAGTISITINDVPSSFKAPGAIKTTKFDQLDPDGDATSEDLFMPGVDFDEKGEIAGEAMRVKAYANELALKMAMGMVQCFYANPEMSITCYDVGKPGASSPDGTNAWTVPAELFVGTNYKVVIAEAKKLLESMVLCLYPNAPHTCSAGCNPCITPLTNGFLSLDANDITTLGTQSMTVHIPEQMFWAATPAEANAQAMAICALPAPTCERMISVDVTATCNAVCKAAGIDLTLTADDKEWGLDFWQGDCEGYIQGIFKEPCFDIISTGSSSSEVEEVKVTVTSGTSGSSCEDLLVSATALCVVECQAKAEYAFTNKHLFLECPDFDVYKYEIEHGTYRGNKETVREILRNLRRYYCSNIKLKQVGRKGVKVGDIEADSETEGDNKTDTTDEKNINEETYAQIDGKQIIELNVTFEPATASTAAASSRQGGNGANIFINDNVEEIEDEDNAARVVQIAAKDTTYVPGTNVTITQIDFNSYNPVYEISAAGGGEITLEPVNPDPISLDGGTTLLDPLVISVDDGEYRTGHETFEAPPGTSFKLNVAAQVPKTPNCITVSKKTEDDELDVPRCEYFNYELSLSEISGLKVVDKDNSAGTGNGIAAKNLEIDAGWGLMLAMVDGGGTLHIKTREGSPLRADDRGLSLTYDSKWFAVKDYALTFIGDVGVEKASFGPGVTAVVGTIGGAQWGEVGGAFSCSNGQLTVPLPANAEYSATSSSSGLIRGVEFSKTNTTSEIKDGVIKLAVANASSYCDGATDGTPGGVYGIGYSSGNTPSIDNGVIKIPRPSSYTFDSNWFDVSDGQVTLKQTALEGVINELVDELAVNIDVTTDLERVTANTGEKLIRATSDATLTLDTFVQAVNV